MQSRYTNSIVLKWLSKALSLGRSQEKQCCRGFTLLEILVVISIIMFLCAIAVPVYGYFIDRAINIRAAAEIRQLEKEVMNFLVENERLPDTLDELGDGALLDPWENPYQYINFETTPKAGQKKRRRDGKGPPLNSEYDLYSMGKDGLSAPSLTDDSSKDDIVRGNDGSYLGLASQY